MYVANLMDLAEMLSENYDSIDLRDDHIRISAENMTMGEMVYLTEEIENLEVKFVLREGRVELRLN